MLSVRVGGEKSATTIVEEKSSFSDSDLKAGMSASFFGTGTSAEVKTGSSTTASTAFASADVRTQGGDLTSTDHKGWRKSVELSPNSFVVGLGDISDLVEEPKKSLLKKYIAEYLAEAEAANIKEALRAQEARALAEEAEQVPFFLYLVLSVSHCVDAVGDEQKRHHRKQFCLCLFLFMCLRFLALRDEYFPVAMEGRPHPEHIKRRLPGRKRRQK